MGSMTFNELAENPNTAIGLVSSDITGDQDSAKTYRAKIEFARRETKAIRAVKKREIKKRTEFLLNQIEDRKIMSSFYDEV